MHNLSNYCGWGNTLKIKSVRYVLAGKHLCAIALALVLSACGGNYYHSIGGTVTGLSGTLLTSAVVLQNNGGDDLSVPTDGAFQFSKTIRDRGNYNVTVLTQPAGQNCIVANGSGKATDDVNNVAVICKTSTTRYAYVANANSNTVSQYTVGAGGTISAMTTATIPAGTTPYSVTVDPTGKYVYVVNYGSSSVPGSISQYTIGTGGGALAAMTPATITAGTHPNSIAVDPSGKYVYVANNGGGNVSQYVISTTDGSLTEIAPAIGAGTNPNSVTVDPSGKYVYVANNGSGNVSQYVISTTDGSLTEITPAVAAGTKPYSVTVDPSGNYVYVVNYGSSSVPGSISQYTIGTGGALTAMSTASVAAGIYPASVAVDPSGKCAYVANYGSSSASSSVSQYTIGTGGALTAMPTATVAAGTNPASVTIDTSGQFVYVANYGSSTVSQYIIGADGALMPLATATVATDSGPVSVTTSK